ncbi:MAG: hypothetical protein K1X75_11380 [Leptospirales bacterium]|nr:hypothetical protein [Leptospirales bacterium]
MSIHPGLQIEALRKWLERSIESAHRAACYSLPLLALWIIPFAVERDEACLRAGRRSLTLAAAFLIAISLLYAIRSMSSVTGTAALVLDWVAFGIHSALALAYAGVSFWLAYREWHGRAASAIWIDRSYFWAEERFSR